MEITNLFASVLPGRIRLRHPVLRNRDLHVRTVERLRELADVESNPATGSLLLRFDPADADMETRIRAEVATFFGDVEPASEEVSEGDLDAAPRRTEGAGRRRAAKWELNRVAKLGSMASMAVSLAALGSSRKLHAQAGVLSVALMLAHIAVHWRRVPR